MKEDSGFFTSPLETELTSVPRPELIYRSEDGWSELYRVDKDGKFRVYKTLKQEYRGNIQYETMLRKEFQIGYNLSNPGICEIYGFINIPGFGNCIEMEWIDGESLSELLKRHKPTKEQSRRMVLQICNILSYLHSKQIVHRDIKPSNILITHNGHNIKLIDFGLADSDSSTIIKVPAGTKSFASPELLNGQTIDNRADIYSLGKIIEMLSPALSNIATKCTKEDPNKRFASAEEVAEAIAKKSTNWAWAIVLLAIIATIAFFINRYSNAPTPAEKAPEQTIEADSDSIIDPEAIDELFYQATDLIMMKDSN